MDPAQINRIANFIWGIADDVLRDVYVRGKYRDVILPMTVIRRLDIVLEPTKAEVLRAKVAFDAQGIEQQDDLLNRVAGQPFSNASRFTLRGLLDQPKQLLPNFEAYLDGFSDNVKEILDKFAFRNQLPKLAEADALGFLVERFTDRSVNLGPWPLTGADGSVVQPGLDNHGMGTVFEELIRRFNEENNEEAGEHFTPRDVVELMANLILAPVADRLPSGTYLLYDGACGTGGMLTVASERLTALTAAQGKTASIHLYGQEVNAETYAIAKADLLLQGEGANADKIKFGSTLSQDAYPGWEFDFMLSNPPYGKSWKKDLEAMGGKDTLRDPRFSVTLDGEPTSLATRTSDGQLMFLVNLLQKMKSGTPFGSRVAEVHNGSALFTGDAGQGESDIRRWVIENDWLEAIVALPLNMFHNTGIATYVWVLTNRKAAERRGKVQLIDATGWKRPLRRNLGQKNCELGEEDRERVLAAFLGMEESDQSKVFPNEAFGYRKVVVERPLRLRVDLTAANLARLRAETAGTPDAAVADLLAGLRVAAGGDASFRCWDDFGERLQAAAGQEGTRLTARQLRLARAALTTRDETAEPVSTKRRRLRSAEVGSVVPEAGQAVGERRQGGSGTPLPHLLTLEPDPELRDTEQVPLLEPGGVEGYVAREVLPYAPDAWVDASKTKIGYEISFTRHFYRPTPLRTLAEIRADIEALERETEGLLGEVLAEVAD